MSNLTWEDYEALVERQIAALEQEKVMALRILDASPGSEAAAKIWQRIDHELYAYLLLKLHAKEFVERTNNPKKEEDGAL